MHRRRFVAGAAAGAAVCLVAPQAFPAADPLQPLAPRMDFTPPAPGSYVLQRIQRCPDALLIDASAQPVRLAQVTSGKITLLSFFYTYCTDALGCPFAYQTLINLRETLLAEPALARRVRFVNISFDPSHDTPAQLRLYGRKLLGDARFEWRMLSSRTVQELLPLLDDFGQDVSVVQDERGRPTRTRNHMLKLFLIDAQRMVREIYTLDFVQPQVMLADMRTLAMEG
jgi:protein SCO1